MGDRIAGIGIGSVRADQEIGRGGSDPVERKVERAAEPGHRCPARQWQVERGALPLAFAGLVFMAPVEGIIGGGIGVDRDEQHVAPRIEDVLRAVAMMIIDVEDGDAAPARRDRGLGGDGSGVEVAIAADIIGAGMMAGRPAESEGAAVAGEHGLKRRERRLSVPVSGIPCARSDRRAGVHREAAEPRIDPVERQRPAAHHRKGVGKGIPFPPRSNPVTVCRFQEVEIVRRVHAKDRRFAAILRTLRAADRGKDRVSPCRGFGIGHEAAIVELERGGVGELARIEEAAHQRTETSRSLGKVGSEMIRSIAAHRACGVLPAAST